MDQSVFQRLRPECVRVSKLLTRGGLQTTSWHELEDGLRAIQGILAETDELNDALTDYVLFPVLQVFRMDGTTRPSYVTTTALELLCIILQNARSRLAHPQFAMQILILITNLFKRQGELLSQRRANELEVTALCNCIKQLFSASVIELPRANTSESDPHLILIGTLLATLFELLSREEVSGARIAALEAIQIMLLREEDTSLLRRFLPGLLSNLVRPFGTPSNSKWSSRALQLALNVIQAVLINCLSPCDKQAAESSGVEQRDRQTWLRTNTDGLMAAFKQLIKAQGHERQEVRSALSGLCVSLLDIAHSDLHPDLVRLLVSTVIGLQGQQSIPQDDPAATRLFTESTKLREILQATCNYSITQLPTLLQSPDQDKHIRAFSMAASSLAFASPLGPASHDFVQVLSEALLSSTTVLMQQSKPVVQPMATAIDLLSKLEHTRPDTAIDPTSIFGAGIHIQRNESALQHMIHTIMDGPAGLDVLRNLSTVVEADVQISIPNLPRMWVLAVCLDGRSTGSSSYSRRLPMRMQLDRVAGLAYNASLDVLRRPPMDGAADWRAQAVALQYVSICAKRESEAFRPELIYALYPILERVACAEPILQEHAVRALRIVSRACGYANVSQLVLDNSDYLVNAVGIRLNTFDVRPESASVLQLAINLCGTAFLPHLDDVAESIFTILDMHHGYPLLVKSMFAVLGTVLDQAPEQENSLTLRHQIALASSNGIEVIEKIRSIRRDSSVSEGTTDHRSVKGTGSSSIEATKVGAASKGGRSPSPLFARIMRHAQFFLTYEATSVRHGLLQILNKGLRALRHDQDILLPVINDIWPVIIARVNDPEPYMIIEALDVLGTAVDCVGDFLSSRFEDEWPRLRSVFLQHKPTVARSSPSAVSPTLQGYTQTVKVWAAVTTFIGSFVQAIDIHPEMEDDIVAIFADENQPAIRHSLNQLNADATWLSRYSQGTNLDYAAPRLDPDRAESFAPLPT